jgi:ABC-2 type transport system permease protein
MDALHTIHGIVARDLRRAGRQKSRLVGGLARPFMWLILVGTGYNSITTVEGSVSYYAFVYPGLVVMAALFGAMLTAISTVYDREFGMLRLMLSSPSGVYAVLTGRAVSATLVGALQGAVVLLTLPIFLPVTLAQMLAALGVLMVGAAVSGTMGLLVAAPLRSVENFAGVINVVLFPLFFLSGALYPTAGMPLWARVASQLNPVTYAVDMMRGALGQPVEFCVWRSLGALGMALVVTFVGSALLFDPERRFVLKGRGGKP